jgi:hypothetical protein
MLTKVIHAYGKYLHIPHIFHHSVVTFSFIIFFKFQLFDQLIFWNHLCLLQIHSLFFVFHYFKFSYILLYFLNLNILNFFSHLHGFNYVHYICHVTHPFYNLLIINFSNLIFQMFKLHISQIPYLPHNSNSNYCNS